jgi:hypothetical protein
MRVTSRDPALQAFLSSVYDALAACDLGPEESAAIDRVYEALAAPASSPSGGGGRLSVCDTCLPEAFARARRHSPRIARIIDAFEVIEPRLFWVSRGASGPGASANWQEGHANAMIVGPRGLESRNDMQIGVSLLAPYVRYPDHNHGPEEVYLVLSRGRFQHGASGWFEAGIGGVLYNEPNVQHALASDATPLFATWLLWTARPR